MDALLMASEPRRQLEALTSDPPHALLLVGITGIGKFSVASAWARQLTSPEHITIITPDEKGTLTIDAIRGLYKHTRSRQTQRQVVIIDHAEAMGVEAQNALLKLLEEPRAGVTFVLTAPTDDSLLPTIMSRVQSVTLQCIEPQAMQAFTLKHAGSLSQQEIAQLLFMADGRPGIIATLLHDPAAFTHYKELMQQAKNLLTATAYERLSSIATIAKSREDAIGVLEAMAHMIHLQLLRQPNDRLIDLADGIQETLARLSQNGNPRAQLTALFGT
ncbi:MAG TPA: AAA family ATPase [Candidatus Saccharimonadales bacterium]|nr:AAA family ATPase [Candidatus Saccharimonadales bacterium]